MSNIIANASKCCALLRELEKEFIEAGHYMAGHCCKNSVLMLQNNIKEYREHAKAKNNNLDKTK
jgi:hypothetical protein